MVLDETVWVVDNVALCIAVEEVLAVLNEVELVEPVELSVSAVLMVAEKELEVKELGSDVAEVDNEESVEAEEEEEAMSEGRLEEMEL